MSNVHGKDTELYLGDTNISEWISSTQITVSNALADVSAYADEDRNYLGGIISGSVALSGMYDGAADAIDTELTNALKTQTLFSAAYGQALSDRWVGMQSQATDYTVSNPVGDVVAISYAASADDGVSRGTVLHPIANVESSAGEETKVDHTQASALGAVGFLHVTAFTGTNITIKIEDGATSGGAFSDLIAFTQVTGITAERKEVAAAADTPNVWLKVSWTGTFSSCTFIVGMERI